MRVIILTCYESNEERVSFVYDACKSRKYNVNVITTDFSHIKKEKRNNVPKKYITINTNSYSKNLSIQRMASHAKFAKDAFAMAEQYTPDLIWLMAPANSLIKEAKKYKKKYPMTKLIIDIIDMWPESLPIRINKKIFPFNIWKNIRKNNINCADYLVTECDFYQDILKNEYHGNIQTIRWSRNSTAKKNRQLVNKDTLSLCYIGSINNIIDTYRIKDLINNIDAPITLHVIGEGENRYNFINELRRVCEVIYHGPIRDEKLKAEIFNKCHAGINIYRNNLYIGLTVKCLDYFEHGLPIINNIKGDTWNMVDKYKVGVNVTDDSKIESNTLINMRKNNKHIYDFYSENFTKEVFTKNCLHVIDEVIK